MGRFIKRALDILLASFGIVISLPIWLLCASIIWISDKGPIFYVQERIGKNGDKFALIKFRTMKLDTKIIPPMLAWLRVSALDELPQLINILKGEMSFVGPRPLVKEEMDSLRGTPLLKERTREQPGLTGVAQLLLPKTATVKEKFLYDAWYIAHRSLALDIRLILISYIITFLGRWETDTKKLPILCTFQEEVLKNISS
jgi:lipopolysaccharide/colanic/teichoic acid biosynthesis glycosyltransferase